MGTRTRQAKRSDEGPRPVVLFDTYSVVFRAFHALPPMTTSTNEPTGALYGASALFIKVLREQRPLAFAFAVDAPKRTFRHERYNAYKAQRASVPDELVLQLQRLPELLSAFGVPAWSVPGFEADDVLATLVTRLTDRESATDVLVVSGDRDVLQLVSERVRIYFIGARGKVPTLYDVDAVRRRFGVEPSKLPTWTALVGDTADNLVGIPGIGPRTATRLVESYGDVNGILAHFGESRSRAVRSNLEAHAEQLVMNEQLARLRRDVPLESGELVGALDAVGLQRLQTLFEVLEFRSLIPRLKALHPV